MYVTDLLRVILACITWSLSHSESSISQACLPCNSIISWKTPHIGFLCNDGFPSQPLQAPYTCLYTLEHDNKQDYTLQLFLHELHFRYNTLEISSCPEEYAVLLSLYGPGFQVDRNKFGCKISHPLDFVYTTDVDTVSTMNITIINKPKDFHLRLPSDHYGNRYGYNITYEIKPYGLGLDEGNLVHHTYRSHLNHCNLNGIPVLKADPSYSSDANVTHYTFNCDCLAQGTWGKGCQYNDECTRDTEKSLCSNHGKCRIYASMLNCQCDAKLGYFGDYCEYPHTAQPPDHSNKGIHCSKKCDESNSYCHVLTLNNRNETRCSCRAGYHLGDNDTSCQEIDKYDIVVDIPMQDMKTENYDYEIKQIIDRRIAADINITTNLQPDRGIVQVQFSTDQNSFSLLNTSNFWVNGSSTVNFSATPQLSLGPMSLSSLGVGKQLTCEAYGGDDMVFTWLKNDIKLFTTNVHKCIATKHIETFVFGMKRLQMRAGVGRNLAKPICVMHLTIHSWTQMDQGKYTCRVSDRHHIQESHLIMNCSSELHIVLTPLLATVRYGSDIQINCRTSKYWDSQEQYNIEWTLFPTNHSSSHISETILYHGSNIIIRNITGDIEVKCTVSEPEVVRNWCPGIGSKKDSGINSVLIQVLNPEYISKNIYCSRESTYGINWQETPASKYDLQHCPMGFSGVISRPCDIISTSEIGWKSPDFSNCTFDQLSKVFYALNLQHSLGLHGPEASLVDTDAHNLTEQILQTMEARKRPLLPGESTHILQLLRKVIHASQNNFKKVAPDVFFGVINLVISQEKKFNTKKVEEITKLIEDFLVTEPKSEKNVTLPSLSAYSQHLQSNQTFIVNSTTQSSPWWVAIQVNSAHLKSSHRANSQIENLNETLLVQIVTFKEPQFLFSHWSLSYDGSSYIANLSAPLVHLMMSEDTGSTSHIQEKVQDDQAPMWTLHYPCNNFMEVLTDNSSQHNWKWQCGRANFSYQPARWNLSVCRSVQNLHGGSCSCFCYGQGLYGLLQVSFDPPPTPIHDMKKMLGVCLSISCGILVLCGALLFPRCYIQDVQLRLLKCLTLAIFNAAFVVYAFFPIPKVDYVWVLILCIWCQIFSLGIGVAQMMAIFINLSKMTHQSGRISGIKIPPMTDMLQNLPVSPTTIILVIALFMATMCSGCVYLICLVTGYELTRPFLPVEDAPGLTGAVLGFMITISVLWGYLCVSNLTLMRIESSTQKRSSAHVLRQLVSLMVGDWVFIIMSLFEDFNMGLNSLFSITAVALSILVIWSYVFTADDTACCLGNFINDSNTGDIKGVTVSGGVECRSRSSGDEDIRSCMSGLVACHSSTNRSSYVGTESTSDDYRTRGDSMLSQISASAAITEFHEANPSHGCPRTNFHISRRNPKDVLPQHPVNLQMYSLSEEQNTNNILLRGGIDFVCGDDDSDCVKMARKRTISFIHHQPVIHENCSGKAYLDMRGNDDKEISGMTQNTHFIEPPVSFSNCAKRSYANVPANNSCKNTGKLQKNVSNEKSFLKPQNNSKKGYLPMTVKDTNDQNGLNGKTSNVKCDSFTVELSKNSESDEESLRSEIINASIPNSEIEFENKNKKLPYINALTPRKGNGVVSNGKEQIIILHKNNVQSQDYVNSPKQITKIYVDTNEGDHTCSSVITKDYVNHKSSPLEITPPLSLSPNETLDTATGDASSEASVHSSPRITREHNTNLLSKINTSDGNKT